MNTRTPLFYLLLFLVSWTGCKSDDDSFSNYLINEIPEEQFEDFTVEPFLTEGHVDLFWNETTSESTFIRYLLVRSRDSLTVKDPSSLPGNGYDINIERVSDINETTFRDSELLLVGDYFYQLFIEFEGYFLRSKPVRVINPP